MSELPGLGVVMLDVTGLELTGEDREILSHPQVGGVILGLHGRNFVSIDQLQQLTASIRSCNPELLIAVDQEGGRVQRFRECFTRLPPMHRFGQMYAREPQNARQLARTCGWLMAAEILSCGLDLSFAPVLDLYLAESRIIADRAFARDPRAVVELARAFIEGMHEAGMKATGKHFPGHGSVVEDSHVELPVEKRSLEALATTDLLPFAELADCLDGIMPGHVVYSAVDDRCAALSPVWLQDILRRRLGFNGVIFSDDLTMAAASAAGSVLRRAEQALEAGCDMILICNNRPAALQVIDWLDSRGCPPSQRLSTMRGRHDLNRVHLLASARWREASTAILGLTEEGG